MQIFSPSQSRYTLPIVLSLTPLQFLCRHAGSRAGRASIINALSEPLDLWTIRTLQSQSFCLPHNKLSEGQVVDLTIYTGSVCCCISKTDIQLQKCERKKAMRAPENFQLCVPLYVHQLQVERALTMQWFSKHRLATFTVQYNRSRPLSSSVRE